jgi:glyoxylate/hydroxypyruvate reductase A
VLCAERLRPFGFDIAIWSRRPKDTPGLRSFASIEQLGHFLARTDILICLLPLTPDTRGILDAKAFAGMPRGAHLINVGRGDHVVEADLLSALESGQIEHATLDVFAQEPLPADHPFWRHERVTLTPHIAALTQPETAAQVIAENIRRDRAGKTLLNTVDRSLGY